MALFISITSCFIFINVCFGQQSPAFLPAIEKQFNKIESDTVWSAEVMPEDKFYFTPQALTIKNSNFKGIRTFAGQIMHLATDNILIWSAITGESVCADVTDVNGPDNMDYPIFPASANVSTLVASVERPFKN